MSNSGHFTVLRAAELQLAATVLIAAEQAVHGLLAEQRDKLAGALRDFNVMTMQVAGACDSHVYQKGIGLFLTANKHSPREPEQATLSLQDFAHDEVERALSERHHVA